MRPRPRGVTASTRDFHSRSAGSTPAGATSWTFSRPRLACAVVQPEIVIGPLTLQTFGLCFALAFLAAGALIGVRFKELGKPVDWAYEMAFSALVGGLIGAPAGLDHPELGRGLRGPAGERLLGRGAGLVRGADRRRHRRLHLGPVARLPRNGAARRRRARAGAGLRRRADRLPALGRRRLRARVGRPLGDVLPRRHRADHRGGAPDPGLRDLAMGGVAYVLWRLRNRLTGGLLFALYLLLAGLERFLVEFIRRNEDVALGPHPGSADQRGDDPRGRHLARGRAAKAHAACPGHGGLALRPTAAARRRAGSPSRSGSRRAPSR